MNERAVSIVKLFQTISQHSLSQSLNVDAKDYFAIAQKIMAIVESRYSAYRFKTHCVCHELCGLSGDCRLTFRDPYDKSKILYEAYCTGLSYGESTVWEAFFQEIYAECFAIKTPRLEQIVEYLSCIGTLSYCKGRDRTDEEAWLTPYIGDVGDEKGRGSNKLYGSYEDDTSEQPTGVGGLWCRLSKGATILPSTDVAFWWDETTQQWGASPNAPDGWPRKLDVKYDKGQQWLRFGMGE